MALPLQVDERWANLCPTTILRAVDILMNRF